MNTKYNYYIYCKGLLGIKTNISNFSWIYGADAPLANEDNYEKCIVKFDIFVTDKNSLSMPKRIDDTFQAFNWEENSKTVFYRRNFFKFFKIGFNLSIHDNIVTVTVEKNYYKFIKQRIMHLHGMYYLLSDIANMMLLKNGYLTLYASSVYFSNEKRGVVFFAPPNTGKTVTATCLSDREGIQLVGEDIVITDGSKLYPCPWTSSYRAVNAHSIDSAGASNRTKLKLNKDNTTCSVTDIFLLSLGTQNQAQQVSTIDKINVLNGYLFDYFSSPIIKILGFFDPAYGIDWNKKSSDFICDIAQRTECYEIRCGKASDFYNCVLNKIIGDAK